METVSTSKVFGGQPPILPYPMEYGGYGEDGHGATGDPAETGYGAATSHAQEPPAEAAAEPVPDDIEVVAEAAGYGAEVIYSNPLPHVLILTAIVVGVATLSVGYALSWASARWPPRSTIVARCWWSTTTVRSPSTTPSSSIPHPRSWPSGWKPICASTHRS